MKKSDIKIDKDFTTVSNVPIVKEAAASFCERFTDRDIIRHIAEQSNYVLPHNLDNEKIVSISAEIYCSSLMPDESDINLSFDIIVMTFNRVYDIKAYANVNMEIRADLLTVTTYKREAK